MCVNKPCPACPNMNQVFLKCEKLLSTISPFQCIHYLLHKAFILLWRSGAAFRFACDWNLFHSRTICVSVTDKESDTKKVHECLCTYAQGEFNEFLNL